MVMDGYRWLLSVINGVDECYRWLRTVIDRLLSVIDGVDECY